MSAFVDAYGNRFAADDASGAAYQDLDGVIGGLVYQDADGNRRMVQESFAASLTHSLIPEVGPIPTFSNNSQSGLRSIIDFAGCYRELGQNEAGFWGSRRVFNLLRSTEALDNSNSRTDWALDGSAAILEITDDSTLYDSDGTFSVFRLTDGGSASSRLYQGVGVLAARRHTISCYMYAGTASTARLQFYVNGGALLIDQAVTLTAGWNRFCASGTPDGTSSYRFGVVVGTLAGTGEGYIYIKNPQVEDTSGLPVAVCSEYVSRDVLVDYPYHGTNQDGSKCFVSKQGNTVNGSALVTEGTGAAIDDAKLHGLVLEATSIDLVLNNETLAGWSKVDATSVITDAAATSPRQDTTATKLDEGTGGAGATHGFFYTGIAGMADAADACASVWLKDPGGGNGRQWWRVSIMQKDLSTQLHAFFDIQNGVLGTVSSGAYSYIEAATDHNGTATGWYRCIIRANVGSHASQQPRIYITPASDASTVLYAGANKYAYAWQPNFITGNVPTSSRFTGATAASKPGTGLEVQAFGVLGVNNFAVYCETHYQFASADTITGANEGTTWAIRYNKNDGYNVYERAGVRYRRRTDGRLTNGATFVFDRYPGDPYFNFVRQDSTFYPYGAWVIKLETKPDNSTGTKWYRNMAPDGGTTGASPPTWVTGKVDPPDNVTNITVDGTCRWQINADVEPVGGDYEPYDVHRLTIIYTYKQRNKIAGWVTDAPSMGLAVNGTEGALETVAFPVALGAGDMPHQPKFLCFGKGGTGYASYHSTMRNIRVWDRKVAAQSMVNLTR